MLPNFLIVGSMKAGTTSFASMLGMHPDIFMPPHEVHFFDTDQRVAQGAAAYEPSFRGWKGERGVGEKTPTYSYHPGVPQRIHALLPDVKLIWLLREPVARAYSHYNFFVGRGTERLSFEQAIEREMKGKTPHYTMRYLDRSIYVTQIARFLDYFPREHMLFLLFEDFLSAPPEALAEASRFLGVDPNFAFDRTPHRENITRVPRSVLLEWTAHSLFHNRSRRIMRLVSTINRHPAHVRYAPIKPETKTQLTAYFEDYNRQLADLLKLDLSQWQQA